MRRKVSRRLGRWVLCAVLMALGAAPGAQAAPGHQHLFTIFNFGPEPFKYFEGPCGVAVRPDGGIYVSDYYHHKIESFDATGGYVSEATGVDPLDGPCGLAAFANSELAVNSQHHNVFAFSYPSQVGWSIESGEGDSESTGVAYDAISGNLYVSDRTYVAVYDVSGPEPVETTRIGEGSLGDAYGVAVSGFPATAGFVYVPDAATNTIKVFDPATSLTAPIQTIDGKGTPEGGLYTLNDAAVAIDNATGNLFVVRNVQGPFYEHPRAAVAEFNPAGEYRGTLPVPATLRFGEPSGIAVDNTGGSGQGRTYVTSGNSEVEHPKIPPGPAGPGGPSLPGDPGRPEEGAVYAFAPTAPGRRLEVSIDGAGGVTSEPAGVACPGACAAEYDEGAAVTLSATATAGSVFAGWSGGGCSGTGTCTVTMSSDIAVSAEFALAPGLTGDAHPPAGASAVTQAVAPKAAAMSAGAVFARGQVVQKGAVRVSVLAKLEPKRLPRHGKGPVSVNFTGRVSSTNAEPPPTLKSLRIAINRNGEMDTRGLPVCDAERIGTASSRRALTTCREALVGKGKFSADVYLTGQEPYPEEGQLLLFNGMLGGRPAVLGHIYSARPFATSFVIPFAVRKLAHGRFGTELIAQFPQSLASWGNVTGLEMKLSRRYSYRGVRHSFLSAGCPAPRGFPSAAFTLARASFGFAGGTNISVNEPGSCRATGK
ncbi:MAG TPA: NHL repeat-containing protein [Solirubrobacterales bacterium]|nr:NHL repeat-containing protein [Solirubrobacterales bacterium]